MNLAFFITAFLLSILSSNYAQMKGKISRSARTATEKTALEGATISLVRLRDSAVVKYSILEKDGSFSFAGVGKGR
jgi:hypothetical protein